MESNMESYSIKTGLLTPNETKTLQSLKVKLERSAIIFKCRLTLEQMQALWQIIDNLVKRTNDDENHIHFAVGDWVLQADEWFGEGFGVTLAMSTPSILYHSCFVSYSHIDEEFAKKLWSKLRARGIKIWYAPEDIQGGRKLFEQIDQAIKKHDKLLLVLSEHSLKSEWVVTELRKAKKAEITENRRKLFPVRLVDMALLKTWECFDADLGKDLAVELREFFIPNFTLWKDEDEFKQSLGKLIDDLRAADANVAINNNH